MNIREAVVLAGKQLPEVFPTALNRELRLEGVEKTEDELFWRVTFSYSNEESKIEGYDRDYKTVKLRDADGELMGARNGMLIGG